MNERNDAADPPGPQPGEALRPRDRPGSFGLRPDAERDPGGHRRQRRRQVDADQGALAGAVVPDEGEVRMNGQVVQLPLANGSPVTAGIETVHQNLALSRRRCRSPTTCSWAARSASRAFLGHAVSHCSTVVAMQKRGTRQHLNSLGLMTIQNINQAVETLSGGQRQGVAVVRGPRRSAVASSSWTNRRPPSASRNRGKCSRIDRRRETGQAACRSS